MDSTGLALPLDNGDLIRVRERAPSFAKTVTLRGNVAEPGRFAWRAGMRIRDLIPDQQALLTHDYWLRREQLGLPVADFQPLLPPVRAGSSQGGPQAGQSPSGHRLLRKMPRRYRADYFHSLSGAFPQTRKQRAVLMPSIGRWRLRATRSQVPARWFQLPLQEVVRRHLASAHVSSPRRSFQLRHRLFERRRTSTGVTRSWSALIRRLCSRG